MRHTVLPAPVLVKVSITFSPINGATYRPTTPIFSLSFCCPNELSVIAVVVISLGYSYFSAYYRESAREMKRLDSALRSLLYSHFAESLSGLATIRAYGETKRFIRDDHYFIDLENRALYLTITNQVRSTLALFARRMTPPAALAIGPLGSYGRHRRICCGDDVCRWHQRNLAITNWVDPVVHYPIDAAIWYVDKVRVFIFCSAYTESCIDKAQRSRLALHVYTLHGIDNHTEQPQCRGASCAVYQNGYDCSRSIP